MTNPTEKVSLSARRPIAPPPLSQHLREFASNPHACAVLGRNLIPVVGVIAWSVASIFGIGTALATKFGRREPWFLVWRAGVAAGS